MDNESIRSVRTSPITKQNFNMMENNHSTETSGCSFPNSIDDPNVDRAGSPSDEVSGE